MKRSILARSALAAVAAAGIVAAAGCSSDTNDAVSQATESAAAIVSSAAEAAQSAASNASEAAQSAATSASEAAQSAASNASEAAQSAASNASEAAGSAVADAAIGDTIDATLPDGTRARISTAASQLYERIGGASSSLGAVEGSTEQVGDGTVTPFEGGNIYTSSAGSFVVQGEILRVYEENGGPEGALGYPTADEATIADGWESAFQNGTITWTGTDGNFTANVTTN